MFHLCDYFPYEPLCPTIKYKYADYYRTMYFLFPSQVILITLFVEGQISPGILMKTTVTS